MTDTQGDYVRGSMDVDSQKAMYSGFLTSCAWASLLVIMVVGYATFALTMGVHWMVALGIFAAIGVIAGIVMNLGAAWFFTVIVLAGIALFVQLMITLSGALIS